MLKSCPLGKTLRRGDLRDALVAYAQAETQAGHIETMSLRAAARDLGVSSGAVYRHFADKDELLKAVVHLGFLDLRERYFAIRAENDKATSAEQAVARAFAFGQSYVAFASENPTLWRLMFGRIGVMCRDEQVKDEEMMRYTILDAVAHNINDLHELGALTRKPDIQDVRFAWSAIHGAADLAQSGVRHDHADMQLVAKETMVRSLRSMGCREELLVEPTLS
ncbi:TetR/AcrR family transcriptional regulator [Algicella marina]|nr:TetR/AcrR family transcriptional regulator [Algicella marina]